MDRFNRSIGCFLTGIVLLACFLPLGVRAQDEYAFVLKGRGNPFWQVIVQGINETAKANNIKASVYQLDNDQTSESQLNICLAALERRPKVLVLGASTKSVGLQCYKEAVQKGVAIADIDGNVTVEDAKQAGLNLAFSVGSDNYLIGQKAAEYAKSVATKPNPKVLVLGGLPGSIVSNKRVGGFESKLKELMPQARVVASLATDWDRLKAANITADVLQREPDLDIIFSASDVMTYGVVESVRAAGKTEQVQIISVDGNADVRKAIVEGKVAATVAQLPYLMGKRAVELAIAAGKKEKINPTEYTPTPVLTKTSLERNEDPNLQYMR